MTSRLGGVEDCRERVQQMGKRGKRVTERRKEGEIINASMCAKNVCIK